MIMKQFPIIYYKDSKGTQRQWSIEVHSDTDCGKIITKYGVTGGKIQERTRTIKKENCKGKKEPFEYACSLAESNWTNKQREHNNVLANNGDMIYNKRSGNANYKAMLAHDLEKHLSKIKDCSKWVSQPKLDGRRALVYKMNGIVYVCSRTGIDCIGPIDHIKESILTYDVLDDEGNEVLDGELYSSNLSREKIVGLCNTKDRGERTIELSKKICFYMFDYFDISKPELNFTERYKILESKYKMIENKDYINLVKCQKLVDVSELERMHDDYVKEGYEGLILRQTVSKGYSHNRTCHLLKYKKFIEDEFEICGYHGAIDTRDDSEYVVWELWYNKEKEIKFSASMRGTLDHKKELLKEADKYIGKLGTVRYQSIMGSGAPEFGVMVELDRNDL